MPPPAAPPHTDLKMRLFFNQGQGFLTLSALLFQLPFHVMAVVQPVYVAIALTRQPHLCRLFQPAAPLGACVRSAALKVAARSILLPMALVYAIESRARRVFLSTLAPAGGGSSGQRRGGRSVQSA